MVREFICVHLIHMLTSPYGVVSESPREILEGIRAFSIAEASLYFLSTKSFASACQCFQRRDQGVSAFKEERGSRDHKHDKGKG